MTRQAALFAALFLSFVAPAAAEPADAPVITWLHSTTSSGEVEPGQTPETSEDAVLYWLIDRLSGYRHRIVLADPARMLALLQSADGVCHPTVVKTEEREAFMVFSRRLAWGLPARIFVLEAQAPRFDAMAGSAGTLDLDRLTADPALTGAFERARNFPPVVATVLGRHQVDDHVIETASASNMYAMLAGGHVDWAIGWPDESREVLRADYPGTRVRSYAISGAAALRAGYVGCSKGPQSAGIVADIDRVVSVPHAKDPAQELYDRWLEPGDVAALHRAITEAERNEGE